MKKYLSNERGLSLIEIVLSIVLISIILLSFITVFIQSSKHTKFNEEKLTSIEVAEDVIATIRTSPLTYKDNRPRGKFSPSPDPYDVFLTIEDGPNNKLKKATIDVELKDGSGIKNSTFTTHIYYEVKP